MRVVIEPSTVHGTITAPPSKSFTHRAIIVASLAEGKTLIKNPLFSEDTQATLEACRSLGAKISVTKDKIIIIGTGGHLVANKKIIDCANSGTTMRFFTAVACLSSNPVVLTGSSRLCQRPLNELTETVSRLGAKIEFISKKGYPPLRIRGGKLKGGVFKLTGKESSQYISALLLIAPYLAGPLTLHISNKIKSKPYLDITLAVMKSFSTSVKRKGYSKFRVNPGKYQGRKYQIEGDFTQASYFFAAAALAGNKITVENLNLNSVQGDRIFIDLLKKMGFELKIKTFTSLNRLPAGKVRIVKPKNMAVTSSENDKTVRLNLADNPDIVQTIAALAAFRSGRTIIKNISHLRLKETDRIVDTANELDKMGIKTQVEKDKLIIFGGKPKGATINSHGDHRMAMALAVIGLVAEGKTVVNKAEVVNKSYPDFWKDFKKIGAKIKILHSKNNTSLLC